MIKFLFNTWHQWKVCMWLGICKMSCGFMRILTCIVLGIISVFWWIVRQIEAFCKRETVAAVIIGLVFILLCVFWVFTFVNERSARVKAEHQRDSISYNLSKFTQAYDDSMESYIVRGDTIRYRR